MRHLKILLLLVLISCASSKTTQADVDRLENLIKERNFEFIANWAQPRMTAAMSNLSNSGLLGVGNNVSMINLDGNNNYIKFKGDTITGYLPYFGERQFGSSYNTNDLAIQFKGVPKKMSIKKGKRNSYNLGIQIDSNKDLMEEYTISVRIYPNLKTTVFVNSSNRTSIEYTGSSKIVSESVISIKK